MQPKSKQYESTSNRMAVVNTGRTVLVHPDVRNNMDKKTDCLDKDLTWKENKLFKILSQNRHDSIWGAAIEIVVKGVRNRGDHGKFRDLLSQLKSQCRDNRLTMENIIGEEAVKLLMES